MFSTLSENSQHFHEIQNCCLQILSVWKCLKLVVWERDSPQVQIYFVDWVTIFFSYTRKRNFGLDQFQSIAEDKIYRWDTWFVSKFVFGSEGKWRKCTLPAFSPNFSQYFSVIVKVGIVLGCLLGVYAVSMVGWLVECFTPLSTVFQSYHGDSSHYSCLSWVSPVLGWGSEVSCREKNPEDPVRLKPRTPWLRVKHFTTEQDPRVNGISVTKRQQFTNQCFLDYFYSVFNQSIILTLAGQS